MIAQQHDQGRVVLARVSPASRLSHGASLGAPTAAEAQLNERPSEAHTAPGSGYHSYDSASGQPEPVR